MRIALIGLVVLGLVGAPAPALAASGTGWVTDGYGPGGSFYNPHETAVVPGTVYKIKLRWARKLRETTGGSCAGFSEPIVSGGRVFVTDRAGISAYRVSTGARLWSFDYDRPQDEGGPILTVSGATLLAGNDECNAPVDPDGRVLALDVATGAIRWQVPTEQPVHSMVVDGGLAVVGGESESDAPTLTAYRVRDGRKMWTRTKLWSPGISANGRMLVSRTDVVVTSVLDIATGKAVWTRAKNWYGLGASPSGDRFYVSDPHGSMVSVKAADGAVVWRSPEQNGLIATDGTRIYRVGGDIITALDAATGRRVWQREFRGETGQPVVAGGLVYTGVDGGNPLGVLHAATGAYAANGRQFGTLESGKVVVADGWVFLTDDDTLKAFRLP